MDDPAAPWDGAAYLVQTAWRAHRSMRFCEMTQALRDLCRCTICHDECTRIIRCAKGHGCCMGCNVSLHDTRCPICREPRGSAVDPTLPALLRAARFQLKCNTCQRHFEEAECEVHRAWCPAHLFTCPWANCQKCLPASELGEHVQHHNNVHILPRGADGCYHATLLLTRTSEQVIFCVEDTTVVFQVAIRRVMAGVAAHVHAPLLFYLNTRAYYASSSSPALCTTVRQYAAAECGGRSTWSDEHCMDVVPPMLASSESVVMGSIGAWMSARSVLQEGQLESSMLTVLSQSPPCEAVQAQVRSLGVRAAPRLPQPRDEAEVGTMAAIVHVSFEPRLEMIGDAIQKWT